MLKEKICFQMFFEKDFLSYPGFRRFPPSAHIAAPPFELSAPWKTRWPRRRTIGGSRGRKKSRGTLTNKEKVLDYPT
jgi:hypothetical protein